MNRKQLLMWQAGLPILAMAIFTIWSTSLDLAVTDFFYTDKHFSTFPLFNFLYHYGCSPAWITAILAALALCCSYFFPPLKYYRLSALFLIMALAIGPGLVVHLLLKDHWGRPRPKQIIKYGGQQLFRAYYEPNFFHQPEPSKSFPCGHCSMGFYFFAIAILGMHYRKKKVYYLGMALAFGLGGFLSLTRLAQGGHFLSDVLMSALLMWLIAIGLYVIIFKPDQETA